MCGKTGTAQVSNGNPHTWFAGYSQRDDLPLCIVVVLENSGGYGLTNAIPVANTVMQKALSLYANS
jgi:cell division protein FtsI/penicillin-binding protein 2